MTTYDGVREPNRLRVTLPNAEEDALNEAFADLGLQVASRGQSVGVLVTARIDDDHLLVRFSSVATPSQAGAAAFQARAQQRRLAPVSYTHLTLPTTPYV